VIAMPTRRDLLLGAGASLGLACTAGRADALVLPTEYELALPQMMAVADDLWVARLTDLSWVTSFTYELAPGSIIPANGMIALTPMGPVLVDPGWTPAQAQALLRFATARFGRPAGAIATHWHADRTAGIATMRAAGVPVYMNPLTAAIIAKKPRPRLTHEPVAAFGLETWWPGAGHTPDNIVVWSPVDGVLLGGCFLKSARTTTLGNTADADVPSWRASVDRFAGRYAGAGMIIPGHGGIGGDPIGRTRMLLG
jgi:glyoxylase-like metal-dependent hydrolase (beta-lactamase superfamily II)